MAPNSLPDSRILRVSKVGAVAQLGERLVRNEEVSGSIPLGSTTLRGSAALAGKPPSYERRPLEPMGRRRALFFVFLPAAASAG